MKFLLVALSALALASAQTTSVDVALSIVGNADGSATIKVGTGPAINLPKAVVTSAKSIIGLINSIASGVTTSSNLEKTLTFTVDSTTGTISLTVDGQTLSLTKNTIRTVIGLVNKVKQVVAARLQRTRKGGKWGKSRKHSHERRH